MNHNINITMHQYITTDIVHIKYIVLTLQIHNIKCLIVFKSTTPKHTWYYSSTYLLPENTSYFENGQHMECW